MKKVEGCIDDRSTEFASDRAVFEDENSRLHLFDVGAHRYLTVGRIAYFRANRSALYLDCEPSTREFVVLFFETLTKFSECYVR